MLLNSVIHRVWNCHKTPIRYSALFINGPKASETFVYLTPHIDYKDVIDNRNVIENELSKRNVKFDLDKLHNLWQVYLDLKSHFSDYSRRKEEITREMPQLLKTRPNDDVTLKYKMQSDLLKDNMKKLKAPLWSAEEAAMLEYLKLPNRLHPQTPHIGKEIFYTFGSMTEEKNDHLTVASVNNLIDLKRNGSYFLIGDAAIFELGAKFYFNNLLRDNGFIQFSNPDFVKSLVVEGCALDHISPNSTYILDHKEDTKLNINNRMHLVGGGSLCSFLAYHAKNVIHPKLLPLRYFTMGRQYVPTPTMGKTNLFNVSQASVVSTFCVTKSQNDSEKVLDQLVELLKEAYGDIGHHFRLCLVPAIQLNAWEMMRVAVEMYSTSLASYVEVGNISLSGDYITKRLMFTYMENGMMKFPHIVSGTLLNVPKLLACVLEDNKQFNLPEVFKVPNWKMKMQ